MSIPAKIIKIAANWTRLRQTGSSRKSKYFNTYYECFSLLDNVSVDIYQRAL